MEHQPKSIALQAIEKELAKAKAKFPWWPTDPIHAAAIVQEEAGELVKSALQFTYEKGATTSMMDEAVQVGAMAIRFIDNILEYKERKSEQITSRPNRT